MGWSSRNAAQIDTFNAKSIRSAEYGTYIMQTADIIQYNYKRQFFRFLKLLCTNAVQFGYLQFSVHNRKALCRSVHYVPAHVVQRYFFPFTSLLITVEKVSIAYGKIFKNNICIIQSNA